MKVTNKILLVSLLVVLVLLEIGGVSFLAVWREWFWDAVSKKHVQDFLLYLSEFSVIALGLVVISGYMSFLTNYLALVYRYKLTRIALKDIQRIEGHQQRIQEDCRDYPLLSVNLLVGLCSSSIKVLVFSYLIVHGSTWMTFFIAVGYTILGTCIAQYIARPLIDLNYQNQVKEAAFRQGLQKEQYAVVHRNNYNLFVNLKYLQYFQSFFNQVIVIVPLLILFPSYFYGTMAFGVLMQLVACISSVIGEGSYFVNSFDSINRWISCRKRLKEMRII